MQIFNSGFFWFAEGILFVIMILGVRTMVQDRGIEFPWWKWALLLFWILPAGFTLAFVGTSFGEGEPVAGTRGGLLFGLVTIISGAGLWRVLFFGGKARAEAP